ncbi:protein JINGUBANG-like [Salvia miltiorrhiza]|uniref:protein JINGUBANG-like n=1 Tax=Salvia miltiorrhiza TaxID=226208 RepID=UPI0025AC4C1A|nr:protein JINGUBANG-like [Salvia miltiorrhiza]
MERYPTRTPPHPCNNTNLYDDGGDTNPHQSPPRASFKSAAHLYENLLYSPPRSSSAAASPNFYSLLPPPSPDSPWSLSPHQTPSPALLYHCIASLHRQDGTIFSIAATKGLVFTGSESPRVRAWRQPDCAERGSFKAAEGEVRAVLAHGSTLFTSHRDRRVRAWTISAENNSFHVKKTATFPKSKSLFSFTRNPNPRHRDNISCMAYNHSEGLLYTASWDRTVKAWRVADGRCVDSFAAHEDQVNAVVVNQDDGCVFTCSSDGAVKLWRRVYGQSTHTLTMTLRFQPSPVNALALSAAPPPSASCFLYSGSSDGVINFWEKERSSGRFNHGGFLQGHRFAVLCLAAIEKLIFSGSEDTTIRIWRREEGSCFHECLAVLDAHRGPVRCLAAALEVEKVVVMGFLLYSAGLDQTFKVWRIKVMPEEMEAPPRRPAPVETAAKGGEYEMSPVLSPSWVEKKLQGNNNPFH